ncbi:MAG: hypothetical protein A2X36_09965 [Elusimicrobia bacterium GWA2_69_24]|nr:MAG: hypothetical protein A2X36_09965 [Elusimicrobia bacterium GWA2_69_24]
MRALSVLAVLLALAAAACRAPAPEPQPATPPPLTQVKILLPDGKEIAAEVADTPEARERGLMFRTAMAPDTGMLFVFDKEEGLQFWMKNTLIDLDMVWLDAQKKITVVHADVPRSRLDTPEERLARRAGLGLYVLELAAGEARRHNLQKGQVLHFAVP